MTNTNILKLFRSINFQITNLAQNAARYKWIGFIFIALGNWNI